MTKAKKLSLQEHVKKTAVEEMTRFAKDTSISAFLLPLYKEWKKPTYTFRFDPPLEVQVTNNNVRKTEAVLCRIDREEMCSSLEKVIKRLRDAEADGRARGFAKLRLNVVAQNGSDVTVLVEGMRDEREEEREARLTYDTESNRRRALYMTLKLEFGGEDTLSGSANG